MSKKPLPKFEIEDDERAFWAVHDSTDYLDWSKAERAVLPNLKPATKSISLRLPEPMLNELKLLANRMDIPYQSLIKVILRKGLDRELYRQLHP